MYVHEQRELYLYTINDWPVYKAYVLPALKSIAKKYDQGCGDYEKAISALSRNALLPAARQYVLMHGSMTASVRTMFPKPVRDAVAQELMDYFLSEYRFGNRFWEEKGN